MQAGTGSDTVDANGCHVNASMTNGTVRFIGSGYEGISSEVAGLLLRLPPSATACSPDEAP